MKQGLASALAGCWLLTVGASGAHAADAPAATKADPAKAQQIVTTVCVACHGADGNSPSPANPNLAGQHADYIATQLAHFKSGERKNPVMASMGANLTAEEMRNVGAYFAKQTLKPQSARDKALAQLGERIYRAGNSATGVPACAGCHGPSGAGIPVQYPRLGGQYTDYTALQLKAFRAGERVNVAMNGVAGKLSDRDIQAVAEYIAGLR